jgi:hypothetical protein
MKPAKYVSFDIEISNELPKGLTDWKRCRPLGISCAATATTDGEEKCWDGRSEEGDVAEQMSPPELARLVRYLSDKENTGFRIVTWNGLGFDFDILAEESGMAKECKRMALSHVDIMFQFFCIKGFPLSLDKAAKGMGLPGKPMGMDGAMAPILWKEGRYGEVRDYVLQDVTTTLQLAMLVDRDRHIRWVANSGREQKASFPNGLEPVSVSKQLPSPDTSWMSDPWPRSKFIGWAT